MGIFEELRKKQGTNGQFPTWVHTRHAVYKWKADTICPTYLICLMIKYWEDKLGEKCKAAREIFKDGLTFLQSRAQTDQVEQFTIWRFNVFYPPDWGSTCIITTLLYKEGMISTNDIKYLRGLMDENRDPTKGTGVWIKDGYTPDNRRRNVFDPIVSAAVCEFMSSIFRETDKITLGFLEEAEKGKHPFLYYEKSIGQLLMIILGRDVCIPYELNQEIRYGFCHHQNRPDVWYCSREVWQTAEFLLAEIKRTLG